MFVVTIRSTARANRGAGTARMAQLKSGKGAPSGKAEADDFEAPQNPCNFYRRCRESLTWSTRCSVGQALATPRRSAG